MGAQNFESLPMQRTVHCRPHWHMNRGYPQASNIVVAESASEFEKVCHPLGSEPATRPYVFRDASRSLPQAKHCSIVLQPECTLHHSI